jgi:glc operon protein GlcG
MKFTAITLLILISFATMGQSPAPTPAPVVPYGAPVTLDQAKKLLTAAESFAVGKRYTVAVAIVDTGGNLVAFIKMDNTQIGSIDVALGKAKTANNFKRPTKAFEDVVAGGGAGLRVLALPAYPIEGGDPIVVDGKIIGAIGVSGMSSAQDEEVAKAALAALN